MNTQKRIAIIGLGAVTRNIHLPAYTKLGEKIEIVGVCDTDSEARRTAREKFGFKEIFDDPLRMIRATAPDIVSVCTPPFFHSEQAIMALEENCHVFCEKPAAENLSEAARIIRAADDYNKQVVVNNQFPYMNIHSGAKRMIGTPEFGRLLFLQAWQVFHRSEKTEAGWRGNLEQRLCFEFGVHVLDLARFFFEAEPTLVTARMPQPQNDQRADTLNLITLEFGDGRAASIILNRLSKAPERYLDMRLDGELASIHTSIGGRVRVQAGIHTREKRPFFEIDFIKGGRAVFQQGNKSRVIAKDGINPFASSTACHFGNFIEALENGTQAAGNIKDNLKSLALVFAVYESAKNVCSVKMDDYLKNF